MPFSNKQHPAAGPITGWNAGERVRGQKSVQYVYTRKQEVLAKYDPSFRARCETC